MELGLSGIICRNWTREYYRHQLRVQKSNQAIQDGVTGVDDEV